MCGIHAKTVLHVLMPCPVAKLCWLQTTVGFLLGASVTFADWLQLLFDQVSVDKTREASMLCYELWKHRNNVYWNDKRSTVAALVYAAKMELEQWTQSQTSLLDILHNGSCCDTPAEKWKNPTAGWMKINVDAAIFPNKHSIGTGCVARDHVMSTLSLLRNYLDQLVLMMLCWQKPLA